MSNTHPRNDDQGKPVIIKQPSTAGPAQAWVDPQGIATAVPDSPMPDTINSIPVSAWQGAPTDAVGWEALVAGLTFTEPPMPSTPGKKPAAGVVAIEPDGRVWVVAPTNAFGGYRHTFPKGKLDGLSPHATAIKEAFEESGLQVELTGYLCDSARSTSVTRYYTARRIGGSPAAMGCESQAVMLVPISELRGITSHPNDAPILKVLPAKAIVIYEWGLASGIRLLLCLGGYRAKFGRWPGTVVLPIEFHDSLRDLILSPCGWRLLNDHLDLVASEGTTFYAEGPNGERHDYDGCDPQDLRKMASEWIWGIDLTP